MRAYLFVIVLAACAKQSTGTLGQAEATYAGQTLASGVEDNAAAYGQVNTGVGFDASCVTASGDVTDPDGDSIPTNATLTFNCSNTAFGLTGMVTGTETVMDTEATTAAWAFAATANLHATLTSQAGASITQDRDGTLTATQTGAVGPFGLARTLDATTVFKGDRGNTLAAVDEHNAWTMIYSPTAIWTPGGVVVGGSLGVTGSWSVTVNDKAADATLDATTPLTLTPSCATRVTAGTLVGTYAAGTITVTWTGCGASTVTFAPK